MCPIFVLWNFVAAFTIVIPSIIKQKCMIPQIYILDPTGLINDPQNMLSNTWFKGLLFIFKWISIVKYKRVNISILLLLKKTICWIFRSWKLNTSFFQALLCSYLVENIDVFFVEKFIIVWMKMDCFILNYLD